jgi:hypothetical protein
LDCVDARSSEDASKAEVETLKTVKESLKKKLIEYKTKLETLIVRHEQLSQVRFCLIGATTLSLMTFSTTFK